MKKRANVEDENSKRKSLVIWVLDTNIQIHIYIYIFIIKILKTQMYYKTSVMYSNDRRGQWKCGNLNY